MANVPHTLTWGQSLSIGSQGTPSLSTVSEVGNAWLAAADGTSTVPLKSSVQQQPQLSCGYRLAAARPALRHLFSTHGLGGQTIAQLGKGGSSGKYEEAVAYTAAAHGVEAGLSNTHTVEAIHAIQGEADQTFNTPRDVYQAAFVDLHDDFTADIQAITGQSSVPLISSQTATWAYYAKPARIGLAQLDAARTVPGIYLVGGQYQFPYKDGLHLTNVGYYRLGELHARAHQAVVDGYGWEPFAPTAYEVTDNWIDVTYAVPTGGLEFDTTTVAAQPAMGFSLSGTTSAITSVELIGADTVRLNLSEPIAGSSVEVGYGVSSQNGSVGLGNLCDGETTASVRDGSRLANWALHSLDTVEVPQTPPAAYRTIRSFYARGGNKYLITGTRLG